MKKLFYFLPAILLRLLLLYPIITIPLWYDENYTLLLIRQPIPQMLLAISGDVHPPLYYLLLWPLGQISNLPCWITRIPSVLFGIASLFIWWEVLEKLVFSINVRRAAWVLFAIGSTILFYAAEGRMYSWLTLLVLVAVWMLIQRRWVLLGLTAAALLWSHNYGIFYVACLWLAGMFLDRRSWRPLTLAMVLAGISFLPWISVLASQMQGIQGGYWLLPFNWTSALYEFYKSFSIQGDFYNDLIAEGAFFAWITFAGLWMLLKTKRNPEWTQSAFKQPRSIPVLMVLAFGPFLLAVIGSVIWQPILLYRGLVPCVAFIGLFLVLPIMDEINLRSLLVVFIFLVPFIVMNDSRIYKPGNYIRSWDDALILFAANTIEKNFDPSHDAILHIGDGSMVDTLPYTKYPERNFMITPCGRTLGSLSPRTRQGLGIQIIDSSALTGGTIWLITEESPMTAACEVATIDKLTQDINPKICFVDNELKKSCIYELTQ